MTQTFFAATVWRSALAAVFLLFAQVGAAEAVTFTCGIKDVGPPGIRPGKMNKKGKPFEAQVIYELPDRKLRDHELVLRQRETGVSREKGEVSVGVGKLSYTTDDGAAASHTVFVTAIGDDVSKDWVGFSVQTLWPITFKIEAWRKDIPITMWFTLSANAIFKGNCEKS